MFYNQATEENGKGVTVDLGTSSAQSVGGNQGNDTLWRIIS